MAIQAHLHQENLGSVPISSQDYFFMGNNNLINNKNNNNNLLYNGYGLNEVNYNYNNLQFQFQQQQQYMVDLQNMKRGNSFAKDNGSVFLPQSSKKQKLATNYNPATTATTTTTASTTTSENLSIQLEKQRHEIDRYITLQNGWLKLALQQQRKQQLGAIIKKLEAKAMQLLKQKDDEITEATKKSIELQEIVRKMEVENQAWQRIALGNETMVFSLNNKLEQLKQQQQIQQEVCSSYSSNDIEDVESNCNNNNNNNNNKNHIIEKLETLMGFCKVCNSRNACVLLLPCRHLCSCKVCDALIDACPVCESPKMASIHALIS